MGAHRGLGINGQARMIATHSTAPGPGWRAGCGILAGFETLGIRDRHGARHPCHLGPALCQRRDRTWGIWSSTSRPTSGSASRSCAGTTASTSARDDAHGTPIMLKARDQGDLARGVDRRRIRGASARFRRFPDRLRQLLYDAFGREPRAVVDDLRASCRRGSYRPAHDLPGLRPGSRDVPAGSLHPRRLPELRQRRPVRRCLRGLRGDLSADRTGQPGLGAVGCDADRTRLGALFLQTRRFRGLPPRLDARRSPAGIDEPQAGRMVCHRPARLGHLPRCALLRLQDSGHRRQVLLCLAGRADRLHGGIPESGGQAQ